MNIFILDTDIQKCAEALCDKHLVKMVLETAQLLCSPFQPGSAPYKRTHYNHPCSIWTRASQENYDWLLEYGEALINEYEYRYNKKHACAAIVTFCKFNNITLLLPKIGLTQFAQAMPTQYRQQDPVQAYRAYYRNEKRSIAKWNKNRVAPTWF